MINMSQWTELEQYQWVEYTLQVSVWNKTDLNYGLKLNSTDGSINKNVRTDPSDLTASHSTGITEDFKLDTNLQCYLHFPTPLHETAMWFPYSQHSPEVGISKARLPRDSRSVGETCCPSCNCCRTPWLWVPPPPPAYCCCVRAPTTARNSCRTYSDDIPLLPPGRQHISIHRNCRNSTETWSATTVQ